MCVFSIRSDSLRLHGLLCPWDFQVPLSMGFPRQEYWSGLTFPAQGDLPDPGIKVMSLASPSLAGRFFTIRATWEALGIIYIHLTLTSSSKNQHIS